MAASAPLHCPECDVPVAADQRYCLACGARCGARRLEPLAHARLEEPSPEPAAVPVALPGPRLAAFLAVGVLGAGTLIGALAGSEAPAARAAAGKRIVLLGTPPVASAAAAPTSTPPAITEEEPAAELPVAPEPDAVTEPAVELPVTQEPPVPVEEETPTEDTPAEDQDTPLTEDTPEATGPPVKHVWVLSLSGHGHTDTFGPTAPDAFFREELARQGALLNNVHAVSPGALGSGLALMAGAPPRPATDTDCPDLSQGCTVPKADGSLLEQLDGTGRTWKAYVEPGPDGTPASCTPAPGPVAARNPVAFLEGVTKDPACASHVVGTDALAADLADPEQTPTFSLVIPNACHDGRDAPCIPGAPAGLPAASAPTRATLDVIRASKAYADGGLVVVLFDHGRTGDTSTRKGVPAGQGGGAVGAVLLSPFVTPGHQVAAAYDQFSVLKTVEQLFGLPALGGAGEPGVKAFGPKVFDAAPKR